MDQPEKFLEDVRGVFPFLISYSYSSPSAAFFFSVSFVFFFCFPPRGAIAYTIVEDPK